MGWGGQAGGWGMGGGVFMILFWVVILVLVFVGIRYFLSQGAGSAPDQAVKRDPVEILRERYARGEIDTEEFEERLKVLGGGN